MDPPESDGAAWRTAGLTAAAMLAFAANSLLCRAGLGGGHADAASFTVLRLLSGAVALSMLARVKGRPESPARPEWGSALALFAYASAFSLAYRLVPVGVGALLLFAAVQLTMVAAGLRTGERPRAIEWAGHALSIVGVVALTRPGHGSAQSGSIPRARGSRSLPGPWPREWATPSGTRPCGGSRRSGRPSSSSRFRPSLPPAACF